MLVLTPKHFFSPTTFPKEFQLQTFKRDSPIALKKCVWKKSTFLQVNWLLWLVLSVRKKKRSSISRIRKRKKKLLEKLVKRQQAHLGRGNRPLKSSHLKRPSPYRKPKRKIFYIQKLIVFRWSPLLKSQ